jgi:hypothetical protein
MASDIKAYRIFIASPHGLESERKRLREVIEDYDRTEAIHRGMLRSYGLGGHTGDEGSPSRIDQ